VTIERLNAAAWSRWSRLGAATHPALPYSHRVTEQEANHHAGAAKGPPGWTFLTNHAHVLLAIARDPQIVLRDVAQQVGITERATQKIVADLAAAGYLTRTRRGRRNEYRVAHARPLRHPLEADHDIGELLAVLVPRSRPEP
jgi:AraC-like DNA-binding protein